ncbi:peptidase, M23/M37 family [alpha proteobacterium U9-1i]|nr:peptidase, M23/M37 family [alpha proteobacterium U9-1i]
MDLGLTSHERVFYQLRAEGVLMWKALAFALCLTMAPTALAQQTGEPPFEVVRESLAPGGFLLGRTTPSANLRFETQRSDRAGAVTDVTVQLSADANGYFLLGFDRDARAAQRLTIAGAGGTERIVPIAIGPREYAVRDVWDVALAGEDFAQTPQQELQLKDRALRTVSMPPDFGERFLSADPFGHPLALLQTTSAWGNSRRVHNRAREVISNRPHYGLDLRADVNTQVRAPMGGRVSLARRFRVDGNILMIDHGQGLVSAYLHLNRILVSEGDELSAGQLIAATGRTGRANGPHLCWRLRWRDTASLDPACFTDAGCGGIQ